MIAIAFTYETITPESAENGETADRGFYDLHGWRYSMNNPKTHKDIKKNPEDYANVWEPGKLKDALKSAKSLGIYQPSDSNVQQHTWFSSVDPDINFRTGEQTLYNLHINGVTASTKKRIARLLAGKPIFGK